ncbi:unnamed protein product [Cunninghamella blakesleeana]
MCKDNRHPGLRNMRLIQLDYQHSFQMFFKIPSIFLFTATLITIVIGSKSSNPIISGMYGIKTLDGGFIIPEPNGDSHSIIVSNDDKALGQIWYVFNDEKYPHHYYLQNEHSERYLYVEKNQIYLHPEKYARFKIQNVKDHIYTIRLVNSKLKWTTTTTKKSSSSPAKNSTKDIILSSTYSDNKDQFEFLMVPT